MRAFFLAIPLAACVSANQQPPAENTTQQQSMGNMTQERLSENMYRLTLRHNPTMPQSMVDVMMDQRATALCPDGYEKVSERTFAGEQSGERSGATEWSLRCH
jgi:hypothetical protein